MIVGCPSCQTRFELEDSIFAGGEDMRVRCSRCRHTFSVLATESSSTGEASQQESPSQSPDGLGPAVEAPRGDLSACFDAAVEKDRSETRIAWADRESSEGIADVGCEPSGLVGSTGIGSDPAPDIPDEKVCARRPGAHSSNANRQKEMAGPFAGAAPTPVASPARPNAFYVTRPPQPGPLANLVGWIAVSLLCLVGLVRGL